MAATTEYYPDRCLRVHRVSGKLTYRELLDDLGSIYARTDIDPSAKSLWDLRDADLSGFSVEEVRSVSALVAKNWRGPQAALVVARNVDYGMTRMYETLLETRTDGSVRVFRDLDAARAWLTEEHP